MEGFQKIRLDRLFYEVKERVPAAELELLTPSTVYGVIPQSKLKSKPQQALRDDYEVTPANCDDFIISMSSFRHGLEYCGISGGISPDYVVLRSFIGKELIQFLKYSLKSLFLIENLTLYRTGIRQGQRLQWNKVRYIKIPIPSIQYAKMITPFLDQEIKRIDKLIEKKHQLIKLLEEKIKSEINEAFDGISKTIRLKNLAKVQLSNVDKHLFDNEIPVTACHYTDVYYNDIITDQTELRKGSVSPLEKEKFSLYGGEVIITKDSESPEDIAIPAYVKSCKENTVCGYHLSIIRALKNVADGGYIFWVLQTKKIRDYFYISAQGVTRFGLPLNKISGCLIPHVEDLEEQKRISEKLFKIRNNQIEVSEKIQSSIKKLKELRTSLINEAVTGQLDIEKWQNRNNTDQNLEKINKTMTA